MTPNPNVNCWTTFAKVFGARLLGGHVGERRRVKGAELLGARQPGGEQDDRYHRVAVDGVGAGQPTMTGAATVPLTSSTRRKPQRCSRLASKDRAICGSAAVIELRL